MGKHLYKKANILYTPVMPRISSTRNYHMREPIDLMKEFTICECFVSENSPYMVALSKPRPYGEMIGDFLIQHRMLPAGSSILEVGGGYGTLMQGMLHSYAHLMEKAIMVDLSRALLLKQKSSLTQWKNLLSFIQADVLEIIPALSHIDLIILNEVIADLDTLTSLDQSAPLRQAAEIINLYDLETPSTGTFNFNIGAIQLVEALCMKNIPAFISEHSCDPIIPGDLKFLEKDLALDSFPREIPLWRHSEYTIRFSHLIKVARKFGKKTLSGPLIDLVGIKRSKALNFIFTSRACSTPDQEIIFELLDHIREYRWLLIY